MPSPVTWKFADLDDVKLSLGIASSTVTHDELLQRLINSASSFMDKFCDRQLLAIDYDDSVDADQKFTRYDGDGTAILLLKQYPINTVTTVTSSGETIATASATDYYGSTGYLIYPDRGILYYENGWDLGKQNVRVTYNAGYESNTRAAYELQQLCVELTTWVFNNRKNLGFKSETLMNYRYTLQDLRATDTMELLSRYRRKMIR